jgi:hypothetical protein
VDSATVSRVTPLREPEDERSWEEQQLTTIIIRAAEAAASRVAPHTLCRYLIDAMDWFTAARPEPEPDPRQPDDPFEAWVIERWLKEIRSEAFRDSADYEYLRVRWERG